MFDLIIEINEFMAISLISNSKITNATGIKRDTYLF